MFQFGTFTGQEGTVTVPAIGGVAGICRSWTLRREEYGPNAGQFALHAVLSYFNKVLLTSDEFTKEIELVVKRDRTTKKVDKVRCQYASLRFEEPQLWLEGVVVIPKQEELS